MNADQITALKAQRKTQLMLGTKARKVAERHHQNAAAISAALQELGVETPEAPTTEEPTT